MKISYVHENRLLTISYLAETLINEMLIMYLLLKICLNDFHNVLVYLEFYYQTHPGTILKIFLQFGRFSPWYSYRSYSYIKKAFISSGFFSKLYHVRSVTQGDALRADAKDIPKMFQILYSMEGESKSSEEKNDQEVADVS